MSLVHTSRSVEVSGPSVIHRKTTVVIMTPVTMCPVLIFMFVWEGGKLILIRRVETSTEECVITVCAPEVFQSPGSHGYEVSSDGMSSCTVRPTTAL
jgi:hypothetical protein